METPPGSWHCPSQLTTGHLHTSRTHHGPHTAAGRKLVLRGQQRPGGAHEGTRQGMVRRKMGAMAMPDCVTPSEGQNLTVKTESTLETRQFLRNLGAKFEEIQLMAEKRRPPAALTPAHRFSIRNGAGRGAPPPPFREAWEVGREVSVGTRRGQCHLYSDL